MNAPARYTPRIKNKKWSTIVCDGNNNQGIHDLRQFKKLIAMLERAAHEWRNARLFHIILTGATRDIYQQVLTKFCRQLRAAGAQCDFKAAIEHDSKKGLHQHVMFVLSTDKRPSRYITAADETGVVEASLLRQVVREVQAECNTLACRVQPPTSRTVAYIELNQTNNEFLNEAVEWASYILKARSKLPASEGRCYTSSRPARRARCDKVNQGATPLVCQANAVSAGTNLKIIRFPPTASGQKCSKTPVFSGISHFIGIPDYVSPLKACRKQLEKRCLSHFSHDFSPIPHRPPPARRFSSRLTLGQPGTAKTSMHSTRRMTSRAGIRLHPPRSEVVSCDLGLKQSFYLGQKILNKTYELGHNTHTNF
ncbi:hypothetical protein [Polaromonas hydrogenivorans]|uniref:Uncharacterized protein n=1 Tax=Polaromonas hydrogenivorans TaxID=335476 RepID=A0AAU7LRS0_9BURK